MFKLVIALLVASASAFSAVASRAAVGRAPVVQMSTAWRRSYDGKGGVAVAAAPAAAATGDMSVPQACTFLADPSLMSVDFAAKKVYLLSKGVSEFVITAAACTATDTALVL